MFHAAFIEKTWVLKQHACFQIYNTMNPKIRYSVFLNLCIHLVPILQRGQTGCPFCKQAAEGEGGRDLDPVKQNFNTLILSRLFQGKNLQY